MSEARLHALSPLDGRYAAQLADVAALFSEAALIRYRVRIEARWFAQLAGPASLPELSGLPDSVSAELEALAAGVDDAGCSRVKAIEARTNHDVKAVEYFVRERLAAAGATPAQLEFVHFACTSEDINNLCHALMLRDARELLLLPLVDRLIERLRDLAHETAGLPMLSRTHGQPASPTTLGKEIANFVARLRRLRDAFAAVEPLGKLNGAVGNYNAHVAAYPELDWPEIGRGFVESLGLGHNAYTTQIEPHDWIAAYCDALARILTLLIDLCRDTWGYISLGHFRQRPVAGEVGSSTMPHKVNPIDFENAEGNAGVANALLGHFSAKLPVSRWQRDLTDSTVLRNVGVALAHSLIGWRAIQRGLAKVDPDPASLARDLDAHWEVLAEAIQTVMRRHGTPEAYERLKEFTRGRDVGAAELRRFVATLGLPEDTAARLAALSPDRYLGLAARLAREI
jgi:adenylosuccinate lyase